MKIDQSTATIIAALIAVSGVIISLLNSWIVYNKQKKVNEELQGKQQKFQEKIEKGNNEFKKGLQNQVIASESQKFIIDTINQPAEKINESISYIRENLIHYITYSQMIEPDLGHIEVSKRIIDFNNNISTIKLYLNYFSDESYNSFVLFINEIDRLSIEIVNLYKNKENDNDLIMQSTKDAVKKGREKLSEFEEIYGKEIKELIKTLKEELKK
ncbi:hypothetical protein BG262_02790 [Floricoccus penangensis]|uniref:Uncharacterized protein n=1 Tax=Floricoccus penangensis TaxID=1859475 RepID=A0A9Q5JG32_9LACT|nr:hypothetical protein [Floricoccus penangensis]OFI46742.1 hypothetical protein BG262_02790 [Floricoccus penangensis]